MKKKTIHVILYFIFLLIFIEIILRVCYPIPEIENFNRANYHHFENANNSGHYVRNVDMIWKSYPDTNYDFVHHLNTYGFRDKEWKVEKSDKKRILFVGDSFVEGMMSSQDETIPNFFLEEAKSNNEEVEVFNGGMMGIGINEYLNFISDAVPLFQPDELILVLFSNDMPFQRPYLPSLRLNPKTTNGLKPRLLHVINQINKDDPIPMAFFKENVPFYRPVPDLSNIWTKGENELKQHVVDEIEMDMKEGNMNFYRVNYYPKEVQFLSMNVNITDKLKFIKDYTASFNCKLSVYYIPGRLQVSDYYYQYEKKYCQVICPPNNVLTQEKYQIHEKSIRSSCNQLSINYFNLGEPIIKEERKGNHLYWNYDDHMRGRGYKLLGKEIYKTWNKN